MKKLILYIFGILGVLFTQAFHIVGGEIEFITIEPGRYRISLIQYKDEAQQENQVYEPSLEAVMFSNNDDGEVFRFFLPLVEVTQINYTNEECAIEELSVSKVVYSAEFDLMPQDFADKEGYYIAYERCCRNVVIQNILNPGGAGMKYVLEIPPLWKDGAPYVNSSPILLKPLSDYACVNQLFYTNFSGTDPDGDSLVYRMATPLNSSNAQAQPLTQPKPHINIAWADGFSFENAVHGSPPLSISNEGLLTVNPLNTGVYVFSVMVEEWRAEEKIGEVQRDFQVLVVDGCNSPEPPEVSIKIPGDDDFNPLVDTLNYSLADDKCFDFIITNITPGETISLRSEPVNFIEDLDNLFSITTSFVQSGQDILVVQVCAPGCPPVRDGPFIIDLIVGDDACPLPQLDTARLIINVEAPTNDFPIISNTPPGITLNENDTWNLVFTATDVDNDSMIVDLIVPDVDDPSTKGLFLDINTNRSGLIEGAIRWETDCQLYDFSDSPDFRVGLVVKDLDNCLEDTPVITWIDLSLILPVNTAPVLVADIRSSLTLGDGDRLEVELSVSDLDQDTIVMNLLNRQSLEELGLHFTDTTGIGESSSLLTWDIDYGIMSKIQQREFELSFVAEDKDRCDQVNRDTLQLNIVISFENNFLLGAETVQTTNPEIKVYVSARDLVVSGAGHGLIKIHNLSGQFVFHDFSLFERKINLDHLSAGVYIVNVGGYTHKIALR